LNDKTADKTESEASIPEATIQSNRRSLVGVLKQHPSKFWLLTLLCLLITIALFWSGYGSSTTTIFVRFEEGHGIKPGDRLQHRGIDIGEITSVTLERATFTCGRGD
jgi:paraquat-inducible protein B